MTLKFADGIEIVIDDEKIASWEQADGNVVVLMNDGEQYAFSKKDASFAKCE